MRETENSLSIKLFSPDKVSKQSWIWQGAIAFAAC